MPSLGYGGPATPHSRSVLVSLSHANGVQSPSLTNVIRPKSWRSAISAPSLALTVGLRSSIPHDHVLRNHTVGITCSVAGSGPALCTDMLIHQSSGLALA